MPRVACAHYWREEFPWELHKNLGAAYAQGISRNSRSRLEVLQGAFQLRTSKGNQIVFYIETKLFCKRFIANSSSIKFSNK